MDETKKEPSMVEAFATVRKVLGLIEIGSPERVGEQHVAMSLVALLERRMGALEQCVTASQAHLQAQEPRAEEMDARLAQLDEALSREVAERVTAQNQRDAALARVSTLEAVERRMGALGAAIRDAPHGPGCAWIRNPNRFCDCWKAGALSDAPPVFTLAEVEATLQREGYTSEDIACTMKALAALRGGGR